MRHLYLIHSDTGGAPLNAAELELQHRLVELSTRLSLSKQERRDEAASISRLYSSRARERAGNVIPLGSRTPPTPPRAA